MLQREFGISAHDALHTRPAWEIDNLIAQYIQDERSKAEGV